MLALGLDRWFYGGVVLPLLLFIGLMYGIDFFAGDPATSFWAAFGVVSGLLLISLAFVPAREMRGALLWHVSTKIGMAAYMAAAASYDADVRALEEAVGLSALIGAPLFMALILFVASRFFPSEDAPAAPLAPLLRTDRRDVPPRTAETPIRKKAARAAEMAAGAIALGIGAVRAANDLRRVLGTAGARPKAGGRRGGRP